VHVAGRDHRRAGGPGQPVQRVVALIVAGQAVTGQLDHDIAAAEQVGQPGQFRLCGARVGRGQRRWHRTLAAAGEDDPVPVVGGGERVTVIDRPPLLATGHLRGADRRAQPPVAVGIAGQHQQVLTGRVGYPALARGQAQRELGPEHRAEHLAGIGRQPGSGLRELRYPVHAVVVGDGQCGQAPAGRLGNQIRRGGGAVEEAVGRVAVQFGPGRPGAAGWQPGHRGRLAGWPAGHRSGPAGCRGRPAGPVSHIWLRSASDRRPPPPASRCRRR